MRIDVLPDDVLVEIFFYVNNGDGQWDWDSVANPWHALVHVCRRWRCLVFGSPRRLNLRLEYEGRRPISEVLDAWPVLPILLLSRAENLPSGFPHPKSDQRWNNVVAALESAHYDRISEIEIFSITNSRWERFAAAMQKPFPELTSLVVGSDDMVPVLVLPDSFLGGSAPDLRELLLRSISLPSPPKLLSSSNRLIALSLSEIPDSGYISPDAMAAALIVMTGLESLDLRFRSPRSRPDPASRLPPPPTRFVLPALTELIFQGVYEYLEALLSRIDAPLLDYLRILFFTDLNFDLPQFRRLIGQAEGLKALDRAEVLIFKESIQLGLCPKIGVVDHRSPLILRITWGELDRQISSLAQVCSPPFPLISALEVLEIREHHDVRSSHWKVDMENAQWVELLEPFTALKNLYLTDEIARRVCGALQEISGERENKVLPALRNLFVDGCQSFKHFEEAIGPLVTTRQLSGRPVAIDHWRK